MKKIRRETFNIQEVLRVRGKKHFTSKTYTGFRDKKGNIFAFRGNDAPPTWGQLDKREHKALLFDEKDVVEKDVTLTVGETSILEDVLSTITKGATYKKDASFYLDLNMNVSYNELERLRDVLIKIERRGQ